MKPEPTQNETPEPWIIYERQPDKLELIVRGVCGALLGIFLTFWFWISWNPWAGSEIWLFGVFVVSLCVVCAMKFGDSFWRKFSEFMRWS